MNEINSQSLPPPTVKHTVSPPIITSPVAGERVIDSIVALVSYFCCSNSDKHVATDWELSLDSSFSTIVKSSYYSSELRQWSICFLPKGTAYYLRVRFHSSSGITSAWSQHVSFYVNEVSIPGSNGYIKLDTRLESIGNITQVHPSSTFNYIAYTVKLENNTYVIARSRMLFNGAITSLDISPIFYKDASIMEYEETEIGGGYFIGYEGTLAKEPYSSVSGGLSNVGGLAIDGTGIKISVDRNLETYAKVEVVDGKLAVVVSGVAERANSVRSVFVIYPPSQDGVKGFGEEIVQLSPNGKMLLVSTTCGWIYAYTKDPDSSAWSYVDRFKLDSKPHMLKMSYSGEVVIIGYCEKYAATIHRLTLGKWEDALAIDVDKGSFENSKLDKDTWVGVCDHGQRVSVSNLDYSGGRVYVYEKLPSGEYGEVTVLSVPQPDTAIMKDGNAIRHYLSRDGSKVLLMTKEYSIVNVAGEVVNHPSNFYVFS